MTPAERELLTGMGNCYEACHATFEETLEMVGGNRGLTPDEVRARLAAIRARYADEPEYRRLRARLPEEFPF
ncbi:MAG TPA: hypothetical protein VMH78_01355 [Thermoplasmata archaeon]|nr:hypothetical protein [Thermoplasmata archaeon]